MSEDLRPVMVHVLPGLRRGGGPAGYGFNLRQALTACESSGKELVRVMSPGQMVEDSRQRSTPSRKFTLLENVPGGLSALILVMVERRIRRHALGRLGFSTRDFEQMREARVVVFHDCRLMRSYFLRFGKSPGQLVLAMSHAATGLSAEIVRSWRSYMRPSWAWDKVYELLAEEELQTFLLADGLVAPYRQSLDAFFGGHPKREVLLNTPIYEIPSGVAALKRARDRQDVLQSLGVPADKRVIGFFGRHHPDKGYDYFCECARVAWEKGYSELSFLSAGAGPIASPNLANFKDIGHITSGLGDVMGAVDLVVSPSRVSYFELGILEAMSLGKAVLMSRIGGGRCLRAPGVFFIDEISGPLLLDEILKLTVDMRGLAQSGEGNIEVYLREYELNRFAERHIALARRLIFAEG